MITLNETGIHSSKVCSVLSWSMPKPWESARFASMILFLRNCLEYPECPGSLESQEIESINSITHTHTYYIYYVKCIDIYIYIMMVIYPLWLWLNCVQYILGGSSARSVFGVYRNLQDVEEGNLGMNFSGQKTPPQAPLVSFRKLEFKLIGSGMMFFVAISVAVQCV